MRFDTCNSEKCDGEVRAMSEKSRYDSSQDGFIKTDECTTCGDVVVRFVKREETDHASTH